jgi:hypothetical protein
LTSNQPVIRKNGITHESRIHSSIRRSRHAAGTRIAVAHTATSPNGGSMPQMISCERSYQYFGVPMYCVVYGNTPACRTMRLCSKMSW